MKKVLSLILSLAFYTMLNAQSTSWKGTASANWNNASNWTAGVPANNVDAIIGDANFTGSFQPNINVTAACKSLTLGSGAITCTLTISRNLTASGTVTIGANGTINHSGNNRTITVKGNWVNNGIYLPVVSTGGVTFSGTTQTLSGATTFAKLTVNPGSTLTLAANVTVNTALTISGTLDPTASYQLSGTGTTTINNNGSLVIMAATFGANHNMSGSITIAGRATVNYASSGTAQTISNALTYGYLRISGGSTKTLAGNLPSLNSTGVNSGRIYIDAGTLDLQGYTANRGAGGGGAFNMAAGTTLKIGGTNGFPSNYNSISLAATSTVEYNGTNQTILSTTYGNLNFSSSSGAAVKSMPNSAFTIAGNFTSAVGSGTAVSFTAGDNITVNQAVSLDAATTFNAGSFTHIFKGNWTNNGTFTGSTSSVTFRGPSSVLSGTGTNNFFNLTFQGTGITAAATHTINVAGNLATSGSGTFTHASAGIVTMTGTSKTISGTGLRLYNLTISGSVTTNNNFLVSGNFTVNGSFAASNGTVTMDGTSKNFGGSGTFTFSALNLLGTISTGNSFTMLSNLSVSVNGSFTQSSGTATFNGSTTLAGTANLNNVTINNTKSLRMGSNAFLGIAAVFTKNGTLNVTTNIPNTVVYNGAAQNIVSSTYHNLIMAGSGTKTSQGAISVNFDFTINPGVTFDAVSYTFSLYRHFTNSGTFNAGTSIVQLMGSNAATITGPTTFNSLIENKSVAAVIVTLANSISTTTLNVSSGNMETGTNTVTITGTRTGNGIILGTITHSHAFANGTAYSFEGPRNLITFNSPSAGLNLVTVVVTPHEVTDFDPSMECIMREYEVVIPSGTYTSATWRMHYLDNELNAFDEPYLSEYKHNSGTTWDSIGFTSRSTVNNYVEKTGIAALAGRWTLSGIRNVVRWNGSVSTAWENASNWTTISGSDMSNRVPASTDAAQIGAGVFTNQPILNSAQTVNVLRYGSVQSSTLTIANGALTTIGSAQGYWTANATHVIDVASYTLNLGTNLISSDGTAGHDINLIIGTGLVSVTNDVIQRGGGDITFAGAGTLSTSGNYSYTSGNFSAGAGTVVYTGSEAQIVAPVVYNNLSFTKSTDRATINFEATVNGNLTTSMGGEVAIFDTLNVVGNITIGASTNFIEMGTRINVGGSFINNGQFTINQGTINFNGTGTQNVNANTFNTMMVNKSAGTVGLIGDLVINSDMEINSGTLDLSTYQANRSNPGGNLTLASGAILKVGGANNFPTYFNNSTINSASTVEYNGTMAQTVLDITYGNLTFSNGSSLTKALAGNIQVDGNFLINSGATFDPDSSSVTLYGNYTNNGTFSPTPKSSLILNGTSKTFAGTSTLYNLYVITGSYTVTSGSVSMAGDLFVDATGGLNFGNNSASLDGDLTNKGSLFSSGSATFTGTRVQTLQLINAISSTSTGVINFNGSVSPVLYSTSPPAFANVNINNTAGITASVGWTVYFNMTVGAAGIFNGGPHAHSFYGNFTNNGTVTSSGDLTFRPGAPYSASGTARLDGVSFNSSGNLYLAGTAPLTILLSNPTINNVNVTNSNGVGVTIPSSTIDGDIYVGAGSILNGGTNTLTIGGSLTNNGTINGNTSTFTFIGNPVTHDGAGVSNFNNLTIDAVADVSLNKSINISGDLTVDGNFNALGRAVTFNGSTNSAIGGAAGSLTLEDMVQNKSGSTTTLNIPVTVVGDLTLTNGIINTTSVNILTLADDATASSGSANSYVEGPMKKVGDDAFDFPLGKNGVWARLGIGAPAVNTDAFTAEYFNQPYSNTTTMASSPAPVLNRVSQIEYWTCDRTAGTSGVTVKLFWEDVSYSDISNFGDLVVAHWNGSAWENAGQLAVTASDPGDVTSNVNTSFSPFTFGSLTAANNLPIELLEFKAKLNRNKNVDLKWSTATESNNDYFAVERSKDGKTYESLIKVKGAGNSLIQQNYSAVDPSPYKGISYYRLRQTDFNGNFSFSGVQAINYTDGDDGLTLFPNPNGGDFVNVALEGTSENPVLVVMVNELGQEVFSKVVVFDGGPVLMAFDTENKLPAGLYTIIATSDNDIYRRKLIIR